MLPAPLSMPRTAWLCVAGNGCVTVVPANTSGATTPLQSIAATPGSGPLGAAHLAHTRCHHTSTRADTPASCLQTLSRTFFLPGNPLVAINVSIAWISACNWHSTSADVWRVESTSRHGCTSHDTVSRWCRYVLCTFSQYVTAASLVSIKACARWSSGLSGWDVWQVARRSCACCKACCACLRRLQRASE